MTFRTSDIAVYIARLRNRLDICHNVAKTSVQKEMTAASERASERERGIFRDVCLVIAAMPFQFRPRVRETIVTLASGAEYTK